MPVDPKFKSDLAMIMEHRHDLGADLWTTPDKRLLKGAPFSTLECVGYLLDLGLGPDDPVIGQAIELTFSTWLPDGRFRLHPKGTPMPCQTAFAARILCRAGLATDHRIQATLDHLLGSQWQDSGWRCNRFPFGKGPSTEHSNPHPTLQALDAFRLSGHAGKEEKLDLAVGCLLDHWDTKKPIGPCQYGIGTLFMQPEFPFRTYNLFYWVYVLSFYPSARADDRFHAAYQALASKTVDDQIVIERVVPKLAKLSFCRKGEPSILATRHWREINTNLAT
ncbi:MAG: hypothetical protein FWG16_01290 [Micrococcales bacterium]|nr:hypothetical protein [Micrococcales bacterium]